MSYLVAGLVLFLGTHSVRIFADDWRTAVMARIGQGPWRGLYSLASALGLVLIVYGFGLSREAPVIVWTSPPWMTHVTAVLMLPVFVLIAAAYVPATNIRPKVGHPMVAGIKLWAFAHLLSNGRLGDVVLFGAFLLWAVIDFRVLRQRDRAQGVTYPAGEARRDIVAIVIGLVAYAVFALYLHGPLIGVRPFG
jgi:uncharacterized membrane protein